MKLKFVLVPLMVLGFAVGSYADCSKDEVMKLIDKEYSKTEINKICGKSELKKKKSKWFSPTDKEVTGKKAKELCKDNGGRLPTIEELKKVVIDCGGTVTKDFGNIADKNKANKEYQSCYKEKGFTSYYYWSSTTLASNTSYAWLVYFNVGNMRGNYKSNKYNVRCVRAGQ